jgi:hypothetical protein
MHPSSFAGPPRELRPFVDLINQVFEIEKKAANLTEPNSIHRNVRRMKEWFEREFMATSNGQPTIISLSYHDPLGEEYKETRTDCDASIAGSGIDNLVITEVIKPIIWYSIGGSAKSIIQQAVVVVESRNLASATDNANTTAETEDADDATVHPTLPEASSTPESTPQAS